MGILAGRRKGSGVSGWAGLRHSIGSLSSHCPILLAKSVTSSENMRHVGGLGDPPKVSLSERKAVSPLIAMVWAAAEALWAMRLLYALL